MSTFPYFGVKPFAAYRMRADIPKPSAGRRFEHFPYFGFKLVAAYRKHADTPKPSAGRRFEHFPYLGVKRVVAYRMHARTPRTSAGRRFAGRCLRQRSPSGPPRKLPRHAFSLLTARGAPGGSGFTSPKSFFRVLEFLIYTCVRDYRRIFSVTNRLKHLPADVLELTPLRNPTSANPHSYA